MSLDMLVKQNLKNKINLYMPTLDELIKNINSSYRKNHNKISDIWENEHYSKSAQIEIIIFNIKNLDIKELEKFIKEEVFQLLIDVNNEKSSSLKTHLRKLFFAYDLLINGDLKKIN